MITKTSELKRGDLILWWSGSFAGWLQWFFTRRGKRYYDPHKRNGKLSHNSLVYDVQNDVAIELNVSDKVKLSKFNLNVKSGLWIYRLRNVPEQIIDRAVENLWQDNEGKTYPWWQWETYLSRWLFEIMYKYKPLYYIFFGWFWHLLHSWKDVRQWGTIFPRGNVCDELSTHNYLNWHICPQMSVRGNRLFDKLRDRLNEWSANKLNCTDCQVIYEDFPDIFELIFYKPKEK